ncbi:hypothetical protein RF11_09587 [Thelohanellus kitauei]|uniref:Uncharacterized protein n=1 Tax=Thelohanellus kitauei TaxID=669202 RepID=A0A0C2M5D4_THEKT|nr:hypothetical protein RF11_05310 [Thelohanellus kitauei]KII62270.1 hypothetical protein RF11_09587 [Thelohanellus kitauei]
MKCQSLVSFDLTDIDCPPSMTEEKYTEKHNMSKMNSPDFTTDRKQEISDEKTNGFHDVYQIFSKIHMGMMSCTQMPEKEPTISMCTNQDIVNYEVIELINTGLLSLVQ